MYRLSTPKLKPLDVRTVITAAQVHRSRGRVNPTPTPCLLMYAINFIRRTAPCRGKNDHRNSYRERSYYRLTIQYSHHKFYGTIIARPCNVIFLSFPLLFHRVRRRWTKSFPLPAEVVFVSRLEIESRLWHDRSNYTTRSYAKGVSLEERIVQWYVS